MCDASASLWGPRSVSSKVAADLEAKLSLLLGLDFRLNLGLVDRLAAEADVVKTALDMALAQAPRAAICSLTPLKVSSVSLSAGATSLKPVVAFPDRTLCAHS